MVDTISPIFNNECLLRPADVANRLKISKSRVYQLAQQGEIAFIKIGKSLRFTENDLQEFILRCRMIEKSVFTYGARINV